MICKNSLHESILTRLTENTKPCCPAVKMQQVVEPFCSLLFPWRGNWAIISAAWHRTCVLIEWKSIWVLVDKSEHTGSWMLHLALYSPDTNLIMIMFMLSNWARSHTGSVVLDKSKFVEYWFNFLNLINYFKKFSTIKKIPCYTNSLGMYFLLHFYKKAKSS